MNEQRRRTSTPTITVFGKVVPNPAYRPEGATDVAHDARKLFAPQGPPPEEAEPQSQVRVEEITGYFEYEERIDTVDAAEMVRDLGQHDTHDTRTVLTGMSGMLRNPASGGSVRELADAIADELDRTTLIARSLEPDDDDIYHYTREVGSTENAREFTLNGSKYYALP